MGPICFNIFAKLSFVHKKMRRLCMLLSCSRWVSQKSSLYSLNMLSINCITIPTQVTLIVDLLLASSKQPICFVLMNDHKVRLRHLNIGRTNFIQMTQMFDDWGEWLIQSLCPVEEGDEFVRSGGDGRKRVEGGRSERLNRRRGNAVISRRKCESGSYILAGWFSAAQEVGNAFCWVLTAGGKDPCLEWCNCKNSPPASNRKKNSHRNTFHRYSCKWKQHRLSFSSAHSRMRWGHTIVKQKREEIFCHQKNKELSGRMSVKGRALGLSLFWSYFLWWPLLTSSNGPWLHRATGELLGDPKVFFLFFIWSPEIFPSFSLFWLLRFHSNLTNSFPVIKLWEDQQVTHRRESMIGPCFHIFYILTSIYFYNQVVI